MKIRNMDLVMGKMVRVECSDGILKVTASQAQIVWAILIPLLIFAVLILQNQLATMGALKTAFANAVPDPNSANSQDKLQELVISLQRQKLINALDKVEMADRASFGLMTFSSFKEGNIVFNLEDVFLDGKVVSKKFKDACLFSREKVSGDISNLKKEWLIRSTQIAGISIATGDPNQSGKGEVIEAKNMNWIMPQIDTRTSKIKSDCIYLQREIISKLQSYFMDHLELLTESKDKSESEIFSLVKKYTSSEDDQVKESLLPLIQEKILEFSKKFLEKEDCLILNEVLN